MIATEQEIRDYWEWRTCGTWHAEADKWTPQYFEQIERARYELEPYIPGFADFPRWSGKRVLEIGVGAGTDFVNFARNGADATGIDLTEAGIAHARRRLELEGLDATLQVASAERLPFDDASFDLVYSWGVIHHAENPERALAEARRVCRGEARIMLYGRHSWVAYKRWLFGLAVAAKRREKPAWTLAEAISRYMESPGTRCYTRPELRTMFRGAGFADIEVEGFLTVYDQERIGALARRVRRDWYLGITAS